jgi:uncharacterized protein (DUF4415 family)
MKKAKKRRSSPRKAKGSLGRSKRSPKRTGIQKGLSLMAAADDQGVRMADLYRPLKKPITVRLDADVLAWFKKDGRRYQTRINSALRKVMEREMKASGR